MKPFWGRIARLFLIISFLAPLGAGRAAPAPQTSTSMQRALALLDQLTPEERVGQLFLVSFPGPEAGASSPTGRNIYDLIVNYHIGGVILEASNDNLVGLDQTLPILASLVDQLQRNEAASAQAEQINPVTEERFTPAYVPLFVGLSQEGDGYPYDQIYGGLTTLPSQMSIGATWDTNIARQVGNILGTELHTLGINLLIGPSLDVLETSYSENGGDLGVRTFGGDPFWVGSMGQEFIAGVHQGSDGQIAVIAKHFPGSGGSNRLPESEVATVRKSLEQLKQLELAPFFAVTGDAPSDISTVDGLLVSHIRYQGFQGNIRATTRPISFDLQAFSQLMALPQFSNWRQEAGVMVSDDLGSRAVRRFYDPSGLSFNAPLVARDAFLAGNDLLYLGDFQSSSDPDLYTSIVRTLQFFAQKYREDTVFAQRLDESVLRILALKFKMYGDNFTLASTLPNPAAISSLGRYQQVAFTTAREAATLISPTLAELNDAFPDPPAFRDQILFITDTRAYQQCTNCRMQLTIEPDALANAVIRLYSSQILPGNLTSATFQDLATMLDTGTGQVQIENDIRQADWLIVAMTNITPDVPSSYALRRLLDERPDLIQGKRIIVFALNAPYYLDATDISKLTAYYGLYSRSNSFIEVAARILFKELQPTGYLPVSVEGAGYDLNAAMFPDPSQVIQLYLDIARGVDPEGTLTPRPSPTPQRWDVGDTIPLVTGVIRDHNGHPVPNGTPVRFLMTFNNETVASQVVETQTDRGVARAILHVDKTGSFSIRVESDPALQSTIIGMDIPAEDFPATSLPVAPTATITPSPSITPTDIPTPSITPSPTSIPPAAPNIVKMSDWFLAVIVASAIGAANYWLATTRGGLRWGVRSGLLTLAGGMLTYSYLAVGLPGADTLIRNLGSTGVLLITILGSALGAGGAWIWQVYEMRKVTVSTS